MMGHQERNEGLYMKRKDAEKGLESLREVYEETKLREGWYIVVSKIIGGSRKLENKKKKYRMK